MYFSINTWEIISLGWHHKQRAFQTQPSLISTWLIPSPIPFPALPRPASYPVQPDLSAAQSRHHCFQGQFGIGRRLSAPRDSRVECAGPRRRLAARRWLFGAVAKDTGRADVFLGSQMCHSEYCLFSAYSSSRYQGLRTISVDNINNFHDPKFWGIIESICTD